MKIPPPSTKPTKSTFYISSTLKREESSHFRKSRQNSRAECKSPVNLKEATSRTTLFKRPPRDLKPNSDFSLTLEKRAIMGDSMLTSNVAASPRSDKGKIILKETRKIKSKKRVGLRSAKKNRRSNSNIGRF